MRIGFPAAARPVGPLLLALLLGGCASQVPGPIREGVPEGPGFKEIRQDPVAHVGERVRWGGTITEVENRESSTWIQVVARDLSNRGRPEREGRSKGRFIAVIEGFVDPAVYAENRLLTVVGRLQEPVTRKIGEYSYRFPVVRAESHYLWPRAPDVPAGRHYWPHYPDPWYPYHSPYYPYHW